MIYKAIPVLASGGKEIIAGWSCSSHSENRKYVQIIGREVIGIKFHVDARSK
jgi:hypothetical protein